MTSPPIGTDEELIAFLRAEAEHYDKTIYKDTVRKFTEAADALQSRISEVERLLRGFECNCGALHWSAHGMGCPAITPAIEAAARNAALSQHRTTG